MVVKNCRRCNEERLIEAKDLCKSCYVSIRDHKRRKKGLITNEEREKKKDYFKKWYEDNKDKQKEYVKKYIKKNSYNQDVRRKTNELLKKDKKCFICSKNENLEFHHEDYSKPLLVKTYCRDCHRNKHRLEFKNEV